MAGTGAKIMRSQNIAGQVNENLGTDRRVGFRPDARVQRNSLSMVKFTARTFHLHTEKWRCHPGKAASQIKVLKTSEYKHGCALVRNRLVI
jgi:hypothetical protein